MKNIINKYRVYIISLVVFLITTTFNSPSVGFFTPLENSFYKVRLQANAGSMSQSDSIAIIAIDDKSIKELGRWPWERNVHTKLLNKLANLEGAPPRVISFDVLFSEPSREAQYDKDFSEAIKNLGDRVILAEFGYIDRENKAPDGTYQATESVRPIDLFKDAKAASVNILTDEEDGVARRALLSYEFNGQKVKSYDVEAVESYTGFEVDVDSIPKDRTGQMLIPFKESKDETNFPVYSYIDVLNGKIPDSDLSDKIVLIGSMATGIKDSYPTPLVSSMEGIEIHAHVINGLLEDKYLKVLPSYFDNILILLMILVGQFLAHRMKLRTGIIASIIFSISLMALSSFITFYWLLIINTIPLLIGFLISYASHIGLNYYLERQDKQQVTRLFGRFVAPQVVDEILKTGEGNIKLGGTKKYISVLFLDIRGFTPLSESMEPEQIVDILNNFFDGITNILFKYEGTLDKFIGDAVMALWNVPMEVENHEIKAVKAAMEIQRNASKTQKMLEKKYGKTVSFGIGIHAGEAVVGNMGAQQRMDYTAIGDTVNMTARLESNTKGGQILVSRKIYEKILEYKGEEIKANPLGTIMVKGKKDPVEIFEVVYSNKENRFFKKSVPNLIINRIKKYNDLTENKTEK